MPYKQYYTGGYQNQPSTATPLQAAALNALETQYQEAVLSFGPDELGQGFIHSGLLATATVGTTTVNVAAGKGYVLQSDGSYRQRVVAATTKQTVSASATYFLDVQPDGTLSWGTAHSTQAGYLTLATVTTDTNGTVASVTDTRPLTASLLAGASGAPSLPGIATTAPSTLDNGTITTDGLGTIAGKAPAAPAAPSATPASSGAPSATYASGILGTTGLLRYHRMDAATGTTEPDLKGGYNGTYAGGYTLGTTGLLVGDTDAAVTLNGSTGKMTSTTATGLPTSNGAASLELLFRVSSVPSATQVIAELGTHGSNTGLWLGILNTGQIATGGNGAGTINATNASTLNTMHQAVFTWDGTTIRLYVDGVLATSLAGNTMTWSYSGGALTVGSTSAGTYYFNGIVDEVAVYNVALSASTIAAHYATATQGPDSATKPGVGSYSYGYTLASASAETAISPLATVTTTAGNQKVSLAGIATGPTGTTRRTLYRTPLGGTTPQFLATLADNATTSYTDATPDSSLGAVVAAHPSAGGDLWRNAAGQTVAQVFGDGAASFSSIASLGGQASAGSFGAPVIVAQALNVHITDTNGHWVLAYMPSATGLYRMSATFTLNNGTSGQKVNVTCQYVDPNTNIAIGAYMSGVAGNYVIFSGNAGTTTVANGSYQPNPITVYAGPGANSMAFYFQDCGGTPNDYVSVLIERLA